MIEDAARMESDRLAVRELDALVSDHDEVAVIADHGLYFDPALEDPEPTFTAKMVLETLPGRLVEDQALGPKS